MNVCLETFGCRLNRAEALDDEAWLLAQGHRIVNTHAEADFIVVRGCSVTARAQRDCERLISHLKRHYPNKRLFITGCLPGKTGLRNLPNAGHAKGAAQPSVPMRTARAYLKVQDGCAGQCTFCIVPKFRGASKSVPFADVVDRARRFVDAGYHEIVVTGCNLALYASEGKRLAELLAALAELDERCRIRLGSLEPWGGADEVVEAMAEHANVCRSLHLPVQSGSDRILKAMKRPYAVEDVERLVALARARMPRIGIGCDLMAGFPGESSGDFQLTKKLLMRQTFAKAHVFPYSERPGTPAATLRGVISRSVRSQRAHELDAVAQANRRRFAKTFVGKEVEVVIESHGVQPKGWTSEYLWFEGPAHPQTDDKPERRQVMRFVVRTTIDGVLHGVSVKDGR